jgi:dihydroorotate dehydrogenase (NAD+) catalytic subunit
MVDLSTELCSVKLENPIIPASGTFGFGYEFADFYDIDILGSLSFKGTTMNPRFGNDLPRVAEVKSGMINSIGLQNPGVDKVISDELPKLRKVFHKPIIANISGFSIDEFKYSCEKIDKEEQVEIIEVNISCPNVHGGGMSFGTQPDCAAQVTSAVKSVTSKPVFIKLTPNVTSISEIAKAVEQAGADGISLINTMVGMRIDLNTKKPVLAAKSGGYSGPGIMPVAVKMIYEVYENTNLPIIGMGGVETAQDVIEMMLAGASAVQVGAANLVNPYVCKEIIENLPTVMEKYSITSLRSIIGGAHNG